MEGKEGHHKVGSFQIFRSRGTELRKTRHFISFTTHEKNTSCCRRNRKIPGRYSRHGRFLRLVNCILCVPTCLPLSDTPVEKLMWSILQSSGSGSCPTHTHASLCLFVLVRGDILISYTVQVELFLIEATAIIFA